MTKTKHTTLTGKMLTVASRPGSHIAFVVDAKGKPLQVAFNGYTRKDGSTSPMTGYIYPDTPRIVRSRMMENPTGTTFHRCGLGKRTVKNGRAVKIN